MGISIQTARAPISVGETLWKMLFFEGGGMKGCDCVMMKLGGITSEVRLLMEPTADFCIYIKVYY